jgi:hypothetical protein
VLGTDDTEERLLKRNRTQNFLKESVETNTLDISQIEMRVKIEPDLIGDYESVSMVT